MLRICLACPAQTRGRPTIKVLIVLAPDPPSKRPIPARRSTGRCKCVARRRGGRWECGVGGRQHGGWPAAWGVGLGVNVGVGVGSGRGGGRGAGDVVGLGVYAGVGVGVA